MLTKTHFRNLVKTTCGPVILGCFAALATPAMATNEAMLDLIDIMERKGTLTKEEAELLKAAAKADVEKTEAVAHEAKEVAKKEVEKVTKDLPKIDTKEKLEIASGDGNFKFRVGGRVHLDSYFYDEDSNTDFSSGTQFRRARLELESTFWKVWKARLQYDFGGSGTLSTTGLRDAFIQYNGFDGIAITVGNQKEPFSLEEITSSNNQNYMERSLINGAYAPSRNPGVNIGGNIVDMFTLNAGVFGISQINVGGTAATEGVDEGWSFTTRGTFSPIHTADRAVHLGLGYSHRENNQSTLTRIRGHEFGIGASTRMVDTGNILLSSGELDQIGGEVAFVYGPFSASGEYVHAWVERDGASNLSFNGYYVEGNYFLTGESRPYDFKSGSFGSIKPNSIVGKGGYGAWQIGVRYSGLDLTDDNIIGGEQQNLTVGLNWFPTANFKFMANYVHVLDVDRPGNVFDNAEPGVFALRAQTYW